MDLTKRKGAEGLTKERNKRAREHGSTQHLTVFKAEALLARGILLGQGHQRVGQIRSQSVVDSRLFRSESGSLACGAA